MPLGTKSRASAPAIGESHTSRDIQAIQAPTEREAPAGADSCRLHGTWHLNFWIISGVGFLISCSGKCSDQGTMLIISRVHILPLQRHRTLSTDKPGLLVRGIFLEPARRLLV